MSATDAARGFSSLLTAVEKDGETFFITRGGRVIARVEPATGTSGAAVKALLRHYRPDATWRSDVEGARGLLAPKDREWPD